MQIIFKVVMRQKPSSSKPEVNVSRPHTYTGAGLSSQEAGRRLIQYGENVLVTKKKLRPVVAFLKKFNSPLIIILMVVSVAALILGQSTDAAIILIMVFLSAILDFVNTRKSEKAVNDLIAKVAVTATVRRDGRDREILIKDIVPSDIILLTAGDVVPADCHVLEAKDFFVNQSALTGESFPAEKEASEATSQVESLKTSRSDYVFMGSSVVTGYATVEAVATGSSTQYGLIAKRLAGAEPETDFERGIRQFSFFIMRITLVLVIGVFFFNTLVHRGIFESLIFSLAVAIGLTPELLPVVISIALSHGSLRMSKKDVIVKNLSSIQNLGSMNILCTDKTGTLTEDKIVMVKYLDGFGAVSDPVLFYSYLSSMFHTGVQSPLENAVREFRHLDISQYKKIDEIPFDFTRRRATAVAEGKGERVLITKGAPEDIFNIISTYQKEKKVYPLDNIAKETIIQQFENLSQDGFRVLAVAYKPVDKKRDVYRQEEEKDMVFMGFVAFLDPAKQTVSEAIKELEDLGVEIKILTGDNELLTEKICRDIKLPSKGMVKGQDIEGLNDEALRRLAVRTTIFARITPAQKERIILSLKGARSSVGYLGDGINDAPALKAADVGISVNNAVDVAKDTADIILLRKSLRVLKDGVIEGRKTFQNTLKYIMMGVSSNFGNMFSMTGLSLLLPFFPMLPSQILLNNLLYDMSQFTISTDSVDGQDVRRPLRWDMRFIRKFMLSFGPVSSIFDFLTFGMMWYIFHPAVAQFQTAWFIESLATQTFVIYIIRTRKIPFIQSKPSQLLFLSAFGAVLVGWLIALTPIGKFLHFSSLSPIMLLGVGALVFVYLIMAQIVKVIFYRRLSRHYLHAAPGGILPK